MDKGMDMMSREMRIHAARKETGNVQAAKTRRKDGMSKSTRWEIPVFVLENLIFLRH